MTCLNCGSPTLNAKFCSRSCAASHTNKTSPKRRLMGSCLECAAPIQSRLLRCSACRAKASPKLKTIGFYRQKLSIMGKHPSWLHAHIREMNRAWNKDLTQKPCARCGYSKHVELAHILPLSNFPDDARLEEVNAPRNIVQLCPNCHWEFDNGLWTLEELKCPREDSNPPTLRVENAGSTH
jgi:hypothetical protein